MAIRIAAEPPHPGRIVRSGVIPENMTVSEAAARLSVSRSTLSKMLNGKAALSADMACRLETVFGAVAATLLTLQLKYDLHQARKDAIPLDPYVSGGGERAA